RARDVLHRSIDAGGGLRPRIRRRHLSAEPVGERREPLSDAPRGERLLPEQEALSLGAGEIGRRLREQGGYLLLDGLAVVSEPCRERRDPERDRALPVRAAGGLAQE